MNELQLAALLLYIDARINHKIGIALAAAFDIEAVNQLALNNLNLIVECDKRALLAAFKLKGGEDGKAA